MVRIPGTSRIISILSDGLVETKPEIFTEILAQLDQSVFSFTVGEIPNRFLTNGIATIGKGTILERYSYVLF